jgi:hypothetical protein
MFLESGCVDRFSGKNDSGFDVYKRLVVVVVDVELFVG